MLWDKDPGWGALAPTLPLTNFVTSAKTHPSQSHRLRMAVNGPSPRNMAHTCNQGVPSLQGLGRVRRGHTRTGCWAEDNRPQYTLPCCTPARIRGSAK